MAEASGKSAKAGKITMTRRTKSGKTIKATVTNARLKIANRAGQRKAGL